jgi:hypothetical protein
MSLACFEEYMDRRIEIIKKKKKRRLEIRKKSM